MTQDLPSNVRDRLSQFSNELRFWLNGKEIKIKDADPSLLLVNFLHDTGLTGTKVGCEQGGCGACTVMISRRTKDGVDHKAINSCLRPLVALAGAEVTTVEGIGSLHDGLDPVQHRIAIYNGTQCGFCTPGFVMNMHSYLQSHKKPTQQEIEDLFGGNLCRCTGYRPILHGMRTFGCDYDSGSDCTKACALDPFFQLKVKDKAIEIDASHLADPDSADRFYFHNDNIHWIRPANLAEAQELKTALAQHAGQSQVKLVVGNTATGIYPSEKPRYIIDISHIKELTVLAESKEKDAIVAGAAVPIQDLLELAEKLIADRPEDATAGLREFVVHAKTIAGIQVRNAGSIAGNIFITKSHTKTGVPFPSDLFTVLSALGTTVTVWSQSYQGKEKQFLLPDMPVAEDLPADAMLMSFRIPYTRQSEYVQTFRIARRPQMAHPIVNAGFRCLLDDKNHFSEASVIFGGLASCNGRLPETEHWLIGKPINETTLKGALDVLRQEVGKIIIPMEEEGFTNAYRSQLAENFFYKFFLHITKCVDEKSIPVALRSAAEKPVRPLSSGMQTFDLVDDQLFPLTSPIARRTAVSQATGEVKYTHDIALPPGGYYAAVVLSTRPHARFEFKAGLKETEALLEKEFPGFGCMVTSADVPAGGTNMIGLGGDDPVLADGVVLNVGFPICLVLANKQVLAREIAQYVQSECISYEDLPSVVNFDDAIAKGHVMPLGLNKPGDPKKKFADVVRLGSNKDWLGDTSKPLEGGTILSGTMRTTAQSHFYMETCCAMAVPGSYDEITIYSSTQNPNADQVQIARVLGIKAAQVTIRVEQLGGGFGGKQNRAVFIAAMVGLACKKARRPVLLKLTREEDMNLIGKRHPHISDYTVCYKDDGTLTGMSLDLRSDGGSTIDCSYAVMKGSVMMSDGCYRTPTFRSTGTVYQTHKTSNTAMRTFGQVQPHLLLEDAIEHVAHDLSRRTGRKVRPEEIRRQNLYLSSEYEQADSTHFGQPMWYCDMREQWDKLYESSEFEKRLKQVEEFNSKNRWRKRGISMIPLKYGIGFKQLPAMNTSTALVHINREDGSVTVAHGGVEMGQGLNTKIAQVVAHELNVPLPFIRILRNNTDIITNAPATAASTGFDLNGGAVALACRTLKKRLEGVCAEVLKKKPELGDLRLQWREKWPTIVHHAFLQSVNLHATELYKAPHYDSPVDHYEHGKFFAYFTYSFSASEVEIDVLTGEFSVIRTDLLYDAGKSPNPAIDIGQIEGGFVQGLGFVTTEEPIYDHDGKIVTDNIWSYKPPCSKTIPLDFRVSMVQRDTASCFKQEQAGLLAVKGSKSTAEPTLSLGNSVYFAIKHAIMSAREELTGANDWIELPVPLSCQRIQQACGVSKGTLSLSTTDKVASKKDTN